MKVNNQKSKVLLIIPKSIWWLIKWPFKIILSSFIRFVSKRSAIKKWFFSWLRQYPKAYAHTLQFAKVRGIQIHTPLIKPPSHTMSVLSPLVVQSLSQEPDLNNLSPRTREIYLELKEAIKLNNKENC
jgi:hypothetical protein